MYGCYGVDRNVSSLQLHPFYLFSRPGSDMSEYLKKIRLDGENLLKEYKNHPEDLLENEAVNTLRTRFPPLIEQFE